MFQKKGRRDRSRWFGWRSQQPGRRPARVARLEWLEERTLLSVAMVKDVNQVDTAPRDLTAAGSNLYFTETDPNGGTSLWKSDGTVVGTAKVGSVNLGGQSIPAGGTQSSRLTAVGSSVYFSAYDAQANSELWKSDGTTITEVTNINTSNNSYSGGIQPGNLTNVGGTLYFTANDGVHGTQLWKSDGTPQGTVMLTSFNNMSSGVAPGNLTNASGTLFFTASDGTHGEQLWEMSGTTPVMLTNVNGSSGLSIRDLTAVGSSVYFEAPKANLSYQSDLWVSNGTVGGTQPISPTSTFNALGGLTNVNGTLYFIGQDSNNLDLTQIYRSAGTAAATTPVTNVAFSGGPSGLTAAGTSLYFIASDGSHGEELWKLDGSANGASQVADIDPGPGGAFATNTTAPVLTAIGSTVFFAAYDGVDGTELWSSNSSSTAIVKDINPGGASSSPQQLTNVGGTLYFVAHDGSGSNQIWKSTGTSAGTTVLIGFSPAQTLSSSPQNLVAVGNSVYFSADDGVHGRELWKSDGTPNGTVLVSDLTPGPDGSLISDPVAFNGALYFLNSSTLWTTNGTPAGTVQVGTTTGIVGLAATSTQLFFVTTQYNSTAGYPYEVLWKSDGTAANTTQVTSLDTGTYQYGFAGLAAAGNKLFFTVSSYASPTNYTPTTQLWVTDGTSGGTTHLQDFSQQIAGAVAYNNNLYFFESDGKSGQALWRSDGTGGGTAILKDYSAGRYGSRGPSGLTVSNGSLFFAADDGLHGSQLWKSDGTAAGTTMVTDGEPAQSGISPKNLTDVGGTLFFLAADPAANGENALWKSNGTSAGTAVVFDVPGGSSGYYGYGGNAANLTNVGGTLYFSVANSGFTSSGSSSLWRSDGTLAGTYPLQSSSPFSFGYNANPAFTAAGSTLFFVASDNLHGVELWSASSPTRATPPVFDNGDASFAQTGTWTNTSSIPNYTAGYNGNYLYAAPSGTSTSTATATWTAAGLGQGNYDVEVTWVAGSNRATNATYQVFDGNTLLGTFTVNQQVAPSGTVAGGVAFQSLGVVALNDNNPLRVVLGNSANGYVIADAVRVAPASPLPALVDNSDTPFAQTGTWTNTSTIPNYTAGYNGSYLYAAPSGTSNSTATATWTVGALSQGSYDVETTWVAGSNRATNAPFQIYDGNTLLATVSVNEQLAPSGVNVGGTVFQSLGVFPLSGKGPLKVVLGNNANGYVVADAVRVGPALSSGLVDNVDPSYSQSGPWSNTAGLTGIAPGAGGDYNFASSSGSSAITASATWTFNGLLPGVYDVEATWAPGSNRATNATYQVYLGSTLIGTGTVNQQLAPLGPTPFSSEARFAYQSVAVITIPRVGPAFNQAAGPLRVVLGNNANGAVIADAVAVVPAAPSYAPIDNKDTGYTESGPWTSTTTIASYTAGFAGDYNFAAPSGSSTATATATWQTGGLAAGGYDVEVTWVPGTNRASNAPFSIYDGNTLVATVLVNEQVAPVGTQISNFGGGVGNGAVFQSLGVFPVSGTGPLRVVLGNNANGYVVADAVFVTQPPTSPVAVDNIDPGFVQTGSWTNTSTIPSYVAGYQGTYLYAASSGTSSSTATASWQTEGLTPGTYTVAATWVAGSNRATNATYQIYDGTTLVGTGTVNQQVAPSGTTYGGSVFQTIATVTVSGKNPLRIVLGNNANGYVIADGVLVSPVASAVDNKAAGYSQTGAWTNTSTIPNYTAGYGGDYNYAAPSGSSSSTATATWQTGTLAAGEYSVAVTWVAGTNRADNAEYLIYDGNTLLSTATVNQQLTPSGVTFGGSVFQSIATVSLSGKGPLRVVLGNNADGYVIADAVLVTP